MVLKPRCKPKIRPVRNCLCFGRDFGEGELFLSVDFLNLADRFHFFGILANFLVEFFGEVVLGDPISDGFAVFFGLNDGLAFVAFVQAALGALGFAFDGDFPAAIDLFLLFGSTDRTLAWKPLQQILRSENWVKHGGPDDDSQASVGRHCVWPPSTPELRHSQVQPEVGRQPPPKAL